jgi:citrate lyase subunit beta/citryl-CoA lyase
MRDEIRLRRSALYMPGANARALDKARALDADVVIMDLEDAVAPDAKVIARDQVMASIAAGGYGRREIVVRVNGAGAPWAHDDIKAAASSGADAILFPKIGSPGELRAAARALEAAGAPDRLAIWAMAETPAGILDIAAITGAHPRLEVIVMGTADLANALRISPDADRTGLVPALASCVLAARARGLDILDGVHVDLSDADAFRASCNQGRALGFDGKTLIHPDQIDVANQMFGVTADQAARAAEIIAAWEEVAEDGRGVAVVDGQMIEKLHADQARRVLALRAAIDRS